MEDPRKQWMYERDRYTVESIKVILALASGTFIVTLSFTAQKDDLSWKWLLLTSWLCLVCSIILGMWAMSSGVARYDRALRGATGRLDDKEKQLYERGKVLTRFESLTPSLQQWAFTIGLVTFFGFVLFNSWTSLKW